MAKIACSGVWKRHSGCGFGFGIGQMTSAFSEAVVKQSSRPPPSLLRFNLGSSERLEKADLDKWHHSAHTSVASLASGAQLMQCAASKCDSRKCLSTSQPTCTTTAKLGLWEGHVLLLYTSRPYIKGAPTQWNWHVTKGTLENHRGRRLTFWLKASLSMKVRSWQKISTFRCPGTRRKSNCKSVGVHEFQGESFAMIP